MNKGLVGDWAPPFKGQFDAVLTTSLSRGSLELLSGELTFEGRWCSLPGMGATVQRIKDPETEAKELQSVLREVGKSLQESSTRQSKSGLSYAQFKANLLKTTVKATVPSHVSH